MSVGSVPVKKHAFGIARPPSAALHGEGGVKLTWLYKLPYFNSVLHLPDA